MILPPLFVFSTELLGDILREKPQEADGIDSVVVVDNVPQVGPERLEKLKNVIHKIFSKFGKITTEFYPEADGLTKGYAFYSTLLWQSTALMLNLMLINRVISHAGTSSWSMLLPLRPSRLLRMQMDTNLTNSIHSGSTSSLTLTSKCAVSNEKDGNCNGRYVRQVK